MPSVCHPVVLVLIGIGAAFLAPTAWATPPEPPPYHIDIYDVHPIRHTYYFVADHAVAIQEGSLRVWRDDLIPSNNLGAKVGYARLDPLSPPGSTNPQLIGNFHLLRPGEHYTLVDRWTDAGNVPVSVPVIKLSQSLTYGELLAVTYVDEVPDPPVMVGGEYGADSVLVQPVAIGTQYYERSPDGMFDPQGPWYPLLSYELLNSYDLGKRNITFERLRIKVRKLDPGSVEDPDGVFGTSYLEHLGLDRKGESDSDEPDGLVDPEFVNLVEGVLFFPDHHPFDPGPESDGCPQGRGGFLCLDDLDRNVLRRDHPEFLAQANPSVYFRPNVVPALDLRFYLEVMILDPPEPGARLHQNAPNPFNPETTIRFDLNTPERARITILDVNGRAVSRLLDATLPDGTHQVSWSGRDESGRPVASGVYFYRLETPSTDATLKMVLAR